MLSNLAQTTARSGSNPRMLAAISDPSISVPSQSQLGNFGSHQILPQKVHPHMMSTQQADDLY